MRVMAAMAAVLALVSQAAAQIPEAVKIEVSGEGAPVLFIPGLASGGDVWDELVADLGVEAHVATLAGFAGAPPVEGAFIETRLAALRAHLEANDLKDVAVVGHSLGGFLALKLALAEPERVSKIVVVDSVPFLAQFFLGAANAEAAAPGAERLRQQILAQSDDAYAAQQQSFAQTQARDPEAQARIVAASLASDRATIANATYELLTSDLRAALSDLDRPLLVLYPWREGGPFSAAQTDAAYAAQYAAAPGAMLRRIDGSAHFIMDDQPEALADAIKAFLAHR